MKEDILEQLVEDWFVSQTGYFVKHNVRFKPNKEHTEYISNKDSVHSDIDILAVNNLSKDIDKVFAVTCKSWQSGFKFSEWYKVFEFEALYSLENDKFQKKEPWKKFREIISDKWIDAFIEKIESETGQRDFTYIIAVTKFNGTTEEKNKLENSNVIKGRFIKRNSKIKLKILTLEELVFDYQKRIKEKNSNTLESTDIGRLMQIIYAANFEIVKK